MSSACNTSAGSRMYTAVKQATLGSLIGIPCFLAAGFLTGGLAMICTNESRDFSGKYTEIAMNSGALAGYSLAVGESVFRIGKRNGFEGSRKWTMVGSLVGTGIGLFLTHRYESVPWFLFSPPVFATLMFHMSGK